ncbi:hypothetical protein ACIBQ1_09870 [Nonomuraea sp. NPDC050153]|uniref:hypothetical protein n=1 Tax=Nonomuraea sp. NPDC050153 TaxID=3364359 RepID=UPI0037A68A25
MTRYEVTASCVAHIPVMTPGGLVLDMFYKGAILPDGVPAERLNHLVVAGMIRAVDEPGAPAREQASDDGAPPSVNARSSKGDLVEYGVSQGGDRTELESMTREQLLDRYVRKPE